MFIPGFDSLRTQNIMVNRAEVILPFEDYAYDEFLAPVSLFLSRKKDTTDEFLPDLFEGNLGGGYNNTHTTGMNHALASYTNELNLVNSWTSGQARVHFNYRSGNTHTDFTFYNGSSGGFPDIEAASFTTTSDYRMKKSVANCPPLLKISSWLIPSLNAPS